MKIRVSQKFQESKGVTIVLLALLMFVFLGLAALAIDLGYRHVVKNELQNAADSAALAATRILGTIYAPMSYDEQQSYYCDSTDQNIIKNAAVAAALKNRAGDKSAINLNLDDIIIGDWYLDESDSQWKLKPTFNQPDAVQVVTRRQTGTNGPIMTFFAQVFNIQSMGVIAEATAALTGATYVEEGAIELPIGIDEKWFENPEYCDDVITFYPTNDSCAGWHVFDEKNASDETIRKDILDVSSGDPDDPAYISPRTTTGDIYNFTGGTLSDNTFNELLNAFRNKGYDIDNNDNYISNPLDDINNPSDDFIHWIKDSDPIEVKNQAISLCKNSDESGITNCFNQDGSLNPDSSGIPAMYPEEEAPYKDTYKRYKHVWETTVPVYKTQDCKNPNGSIEIVGFARIMVTDIQGAPNKLVEGKVICNFVEVGRGGGSDYSIKGDIPNIVK